MKLKDIVLDLFGPQPEPEPPPRARPEPRTPPKPAPSPPPSTSAAMPTQAAAPAHPPGARTEAEVLAVVRSTGAAFRRVLFTRNRRIMASVGKDRAVLRLNEAFAAAPDPVLLAVAVLFTARRGKKKDEAREAVRQFIAAIPFTPTPPRQRIRRQHPADAPIVERLRAEFDRVNRLHFKGSLPRVPIYLSRQMRRRNGHFSSHPLEIVISRRLCTHGAPGEAEHTVRHEMVHLWQYINGLPVDHGMPFRRMARKLDVHPRATRTVRWKGR